MTVLEYDVMLLKLQMIFEDCAENGPFSDEKFYRQLYEIVARDKKRHEQKQAALSPMRQRHAMTRQPAAQRQKRKKL